MKTGFITKQISNQYTLRDIQTNDIFIAQARGKFRYMKLDTGSAFNKNVTAKTKKEPKTMMVSPKVGDYVTYVVEGDHVWITEIKPRKSELERPDVVNVDQVLLVFSCVRPDFSFYLLDKFLVILNQEGLQPVIVISKIDLVDDNTLKEIEKGMSYYETLGYDIYYVNSKQRIGIDVLAHIFKHKITVLAGQTGVGKSTLLNALMPELGLKTQEISVALGRGKHTTRHTELYPYNEGYIVDTPGFSKIAFSIYYEEDLRFLYPDFIKYSDTCRFGNKCIHVHEPGCGIKEAVKNGEIPQFRYDNYLQFIEEIKDQKLKF